MRTRAVVLVLALASLGGCARAVSPGSLGDAGPVTETGACPDGGDACLRVAAPRSIAPLSTALTTSLRPTFHWELAPGTDGAVVEICRDRACSALATSFRAAGSSGRPDADLAASGAFYWRARGVAAGVVGAATSPVWQFSVGARTAARDASWGAQVDVNGDNLFDLAVGAPNVDGAAGNVRVFLGGASGVSATPAATLTGPDGASSNFGDVVASAGDVNGDGYADLAVGAYLTNGRVGAVHVYAGGPAGLSRAPAVTLRGSDGGNALFGISVTSLGDVNGDGYADLAVGASGAMGSAGRVYVYLGGAAGLGAAPSAVLNGPDGAGGNFGRSIAGALDVNADGFGDLVVGAFAVGRAHVYLGGAAGLGAAPASTLTGTAAGSTRFGYSVGSAGDVNGDGFADVVVGSNGARSNAGVVDVFFGGEAGVSPPATLHLEGPDGAGGFFGNPVVGAGDTNRDGFADLAVGAVGVNGGEGRVHVYAGGPMGPAATPSVTLVGIDGQNGTFGRSLAGLDANGDGASDLLVGDADANGGAGSAYVFGGAPAGLRSTPSVTLDGADAAGGFGNAVASRARTSRRPAS